MKTLLALLVLSVPCFADDVMITQTACNAQSLAATNAVAQTNITLQRELATAKLALATCQSKLPPAPKDQAKPTKMQTFKKATAPKK